MTDARRPRLLIPDNTPLSLLSMMGKEALDWLFELGAEVWVTGMVREARTWSGPAPGAARRVAGLVLRHANHILVQPTAQGADYQREMRNWVGAGRIKADRPTWRGRGEASIADIVPLAA